MLLSADTPTTSCTLSPSRSKSVLSFVRSTSLCDATRETRSCAIEWFAQHHRGATRSPQVVDRVFIAFSSAFWCLLQLCYSVIRTSLSLASNFLLSLLRHRQQLLSLLDAIVASRPIRSISIVHDGPNPPSLPPRVQRLFPILPLTSLLGIISWIRCRKLEL